MGKRVEPEEKILQRGIGFNFRQHRFFNKYRDFKPDQYCRDAIDEQIRLIDPEFLNEKEKENGELH